MSHHDTFCCVTGLLKKDIERYPNFSTNKDFGRNKVKFIRQNILQKETFHIKNIQITRAGFHKQVTIIRFLFSFYLCRATQLFRRLIL